MYQSNISAIAKLRVYPDAVSKNRMEEKKNEKQQGTMKYLARVGQLCQYARHGEFSFVARADVVRRRQVDGTGNPLVFRNTHLAENLPKISRLTFRTKT